MLSRQLTPWPTHRASLRGHDFALAGRSASGHNWAMPRTARADLGGYCYHALNRGNNRARVFHDDDDYHDFVRLLRQACARQPMRLLGFCLMPNHFHAVLWPQGDGAMGPWMQWLLTAHVHGYRKRYRGSGHVWQGRFKAFPIEQDEHLLTVLRYVERNPLRANLVERVESWPWSSLRLWVDRSVLPWLDSGPVARPTHWLDYVQTPQTEEELKRVRHSVDRGSPYGRGAWVEETAAKLGLESSLNRPGRPRQEEVPGSDELFSPEQP